MDNSLSLVLFTSLLRSNESNGSNGSFKIPGEWCMSVLRCDTGLGGDLRHARLFEVDSFHFS